jgi:hypothetical protein
MERTTLTLDADLARTLRQRAHDSRRPFKEVVNEAIRAGLAGDRPARRRAYRVKPRHLGGVRPGIDLDKGLQLAAALEDAETARELERRK